MVNSETFTRFPILRPKQHRIDGFHGGSDVRFWLLADIMALGDLLPLYPRSGHSEGSRGMSVNDPKRTSRGLIFASVYDVKSPRLQPKPNIRPGPHFGSQVAPIPLTRPGPLLGGQVTDLQLVVTTVGIGCTSSLPSG